ncbi:MAG: 4-hydroxy-tetrahydrodipicolinate reductase [Gammaproteobacteria bacterium]|nr:4-hydroxy-tetrahydrodipicolinate reductase [Gammaproteobacteria bacterium]
MTRVGICGAAGQMGRTITQLVTASNDLQLTSACDHPSCGVISHDTGEVAGVGNIDVPIIEGIADTVRDCDVLVDFSHADSSVEAAESCKSQSKGLVIGTTGLNDEQLAFVTLASQSVPILMSPNMSIGVNITFKLVEIATKALGDDVDIEIFEIHHSLKNDSPSGTAVRLGEIVADARDVELDEKAVHGRVGFTGQRKSGTIGFHSARGGDIVGEHTVVYAGIGERVEITHRAQSRVNFGAGAIRAVRFIAAKMEVGETGFFDMDSVLGLGA